MCNLSPDRLPPSKALITGAKNQLVWKEILYRRQYSRVLGYQMAKITGRLLSVYQLSWPLDKLASHPVPAADQAVFLQRECQDHGSCWADLIITKKQLADLPHKCLRSLTSGLPRSRAGMQILTLRVTHFYKDHEARNLIESCQGSTLHNITHQAAVAALEGKGTETWSRRLARRRSEEPQEVREKR